jgi:hypothetical protein
MVCWYPIDIFNIGSDYHTNHCLLITDDKAMLVRKKNYIKYKSINTPLANSRRIAALRTFPDFLTAASGSQNPPVRGNNI